MNGTNICPISLECGLAVPRTSIEVIDGHGEATPGTAASPGPSLATRLASGAVPPPSARLSRTYTATASAGPMSTGPTPAQYLTSDGRLDVSSMMGNSSHSQSSNHVPRIGSIRLGRGPSRSTSSNHQRPSPSSSNAIGQMANGTSSSTSAVQDGAMSKQQGETVGLERSNSTELQLTSKQQQLAEACRARDLRSLQQSSAGVVSASAALDQCGNTALHLLLLPQPALAVVQHAVGLLRVPSGGSLASLATHKSSSKPLGWLTACFGGGSSNISSSSSTVTASRSAHGSTRARPAAAAATAAMVTTLLAAGADVNVRNHDGLTPIMLAVQQLVHLLESGSSSSKVTAGLKVLEAVCRHPLADMNMKDPAGKTALAHLMLPATATCFSTACDASIAAGAAAGEYSVGGASAASSGWGSVAGLSSPAAAAHLKAVQLLVHCGADINAADHSGLTILMHAASQPTVTKELLQLLLESGANPLLLDNKRRSALTHALVAQQLKLLPAVGPGFEKWQQSVTARQAAAASYSASNYPKQMGPTSASSFAGMQAVATAAGAVDGGDKITTAQTSSCSSPASVSDVASSLNNCNMSSNSSNASQDASIKPLCSTYVNPFPLPSHGSVIRALCSYGSLDLHPGSINTRFPAIDGYSQLHIAMRRGDPRAQELLLAGGADVNALDTWGNSPLMYWPVAPAEPAELVETLVAALLRHGADSNLSNNDGWTPLDLACDLDKFGKVHVKPKCVPVHALLVGFGAKNSDAFMNQHRHQPTMMCLRTDSANSVLRVSKSYDSLRVVVPSVVEAAHDLGLPTTAVLEEP